MRVKRVLKAVLVAAVAAGLIGFSLTAAFAQSGKHRGHSMKQRQPMMVLLHQLNLSDEQKKEVRAVFEKYRGERKQNFSSIMAAREQLAKTTFASPYNEQEVRENFRKVAAIEEDMAVLRAKMTAEISSLLTPEQRSKAQDLISKRFEKIRSRMENRGDEVPEAPDAE